MCHILKAMKKFILIKVVFAETFFFTLFHDIFLIPNMDLAIKHSVYFSGIGLLLFNKMFSLYYPTISPTILPNLKILLKKGPVNDLKFQTLSPNGIILSYQLDKFIHILRVVGWYFSFLFKF